MGCTVPAEPLPGAIPMSARNITAVSVLALLAGCQMATRSVKPPPLDAEGELRVYLQEMPPQSERLKFSLEQPGRHAQRRAGVPAHRRPGRGLRQGRPAPARARLRAPPPRRVHRFLAPREEGHPRVRGRRPPVEPARPCRPGADRLAVPPHPGPRPCCHPLPAVRPVARQGVRVPALVRRHRPADAARRADGIRHRHRHGQRDRLRQEDPPGCGGARRRSRPAGPRGGPAPGKALRCTVVRGRGGLLRSGLRRGDRACPAPARGPPPGTGARRRRTHARGHERRQQHGGLRGFAGARRGRAGKGGNPAHGPPHGPGGQEGLRLQPGVEQRHGDRRRRARRGRDHRHRRGAGARRSEPERRSDVPGLAVVGLHAGAVGAVARQREPDLRRLQRGVGPRGPPDRLRLREHGGHRATPALRPAHPAAGGAGGAAGPGHLARHRRRLRRAALRDPLPPGVAAMELTSRKVLPILETGDSPYGAAVVGERR